MLLIPFILIIIAGISIYLNLKKDISTFSADPKLQILQKIHDRREKEMDNVDHVLTRDIKLGNSDIEKLQLLPMHTTCGNFVPGQEVAIQNNIPPEHLLLIKKRQKEDTSFIINQTGIFYWDKIYQTDPVNINFAINGIKYVTENVNMYPSYEILKNNSQLMEKEQRIPL